MFCAGSSNSNPGVPSWSSSGHACAGADSGCHRRGQRLLTAGVQRKRRGSPSAGSRPARWPGRVRCGPPAWPGAPPLELEPGGGPAPGITASWIGGGRNSRGGAGMAGGGARHGAGGGARDGAGGGARDGAGGGARRPGARGTREGSRAPSASGWPVGSLVTCALPSSGRPRRKCRKRGISLESPYAFPRRWYRPGSGATWTLAHAVAGSGREGPRVTQATPVPPTCLKFSCPAPDGDR